MNGKVGGDGMGPGFLICWQELSIITALCIKHGDWTSEEAL